MCPVFLRRVSDSQAWTQGLFCSCSQGVIREDSHVSPSLLPQIKSPLVCLEVWGRDCPSLPIKSVWPSEEGRAPVGRRGPGVWRIWWFFGRSGDGKTPKLSVFHNQGLPPLSPPICDAVPLSTSPGREGSGENLELTPP